MSRELRATAILDARDNMGGAFSAAAAKLKDLDGKFRNFERGAKALAQSQVGSFGRMNEATLKSISGFRGQHEALKIARTQFRAAQDDVQRLARAMKDAEKPTRAMTMEYERSQRAVKQAAAAYQEKVTAVKAAKAEMAGYGVTLANVNKVQAGLAPPWRAYPTNRPSPQVKPDSRKPESHKPAASVPAHKSTSVDAGDAVVGLGVSKVAKDMLLSGSKVDSERSQMRQAGWTEKEIKTTERHANRLAVEWGVSPSTGMNIIREGRPTFGGDLQQTLKSVPDFFATRTSMRQKSPGASDDELDRQLGMMIKSGEIMGYSQDPTKLKTFADFMTKMVQVHGSALRGEDILNFAKRSKTAGQNASFEMLASMFPTLLPEMSGNDLGTSLMTLRQAMVGGKMKHAAVKNLKDLGLVEDGKEILVPKTGEIKGIKPGGIKGSKLLESNLPAWVSEYLMPAMDKKGISPEGRNEVLSGLFSDRNAEQMISLIMNNRERMKKDEDTTRKALGIEGAKQALKDDPFLVANRVKSGVDNAGAAVSDPFLGPLKEAGGGAADALNNLAEAARGNTQATVAGGVAGAGFGALGMGALTRGAHWGWRLGLGGVGTLGGGMLGGLALPYLIQQAYPDLKKKAEADTAYAFNKNGRGVPMGDGRFFTGYDGYGDRLNRRMKPSPFPEVFGGDVPRIKPPEIPAELNNLGLGDVGAKAGSDFTENLGRELEVAKERARTTAAEIKALLSFTASPKVSIDGLNQGVSKAGNE